MASDRTGYKFSRGRNSGLRRKGQRPAAHSAGQLGDPSCEMTTPCVAVASANAVSPAISLAVSPSNGREQPTIETLGSQSSNQSGGESISQRPNCYACKHRRELVGDAHSRCSHPRITNEDSITSPLFLMTGLTPPAMKRLNVTGDQHGINRGWFMWPLNFDPAWLQTCDGFEV